MAKKDTPNWGILYHSNQTWFNKAIEGVIINVINLVPKSIQPWEFWLTIFDTIAGSEHRYKIIQKEGRSYAGFIIGCWNQDKKLDGFLGGSDEQFVALAKQAVIPQSPKMTNTLSSALFIVSELRQGIPNIGLAPWCDDRCTNVPMESYLAIGKGEKRSWSSKTNW
mgnify:FL=1